MIHGKKRKKLQYTYKRDDKIKTIVLKTFATHCNIIIFLGSLYLEVHLVNIEVIYSTTH